MSSSSTAPARPRTTAPAALRFRFVAIMLVAIASISLAIFYGSPPSFFNPNRKFFIGHFTPPVSSVALSLRVKLTESLHFISQFFILYHGSSYIFHSNCTRKCSVCDVFGFTAEIEAFLSLDYEISLCWCWRQL